jgi:hypothetical protein
MESGHTGRRANTVHCLCGRRTYVGRRTPERPNLRTPGRWSTWRRSARIAPRCSPALRRPESEILGNRSPGTLPAYFLEHLVVTAETPPADLDHLAAFDRNLRGCGACQTDFGGICDGAGMRWRGC